MISVSCLIAVKIYEYVLRLNKNENKLSLNFTKTNFMIIISFDVSISRSPDVFISE